MEKAKLRAAVITSSDSGFRGEREDVSGPAVRKMMEDAGYEVTENLLLPDEQEELEKALKAICDEGRADLILTTGGTGFSPRDVVPEATIAVSERLVPGIPEAMRAYSMTITPRAMLSRAAAGIRRQTLIINLPGSPRAARENLEVVLPALEHGLEILLGRTGNCAAPSETGAGGKKR